MTMSVKTGEYLPKLFLIDQQATMCADEMKLGLAQGNSEQVSNSIPKTTSSESEIDVKKKRNSFNCFQKVELEEIFFYNAYPTRKACQYLADRFGTSTHSVKIWFKNRRARQKKDVTQYSNQACHKTKGTYLTNPLQVPNTVQVPSANFPSSIPGPRVSPWQQNQRVEYNLNQFFSCPGGMRNNLHPSFSFYQKLTE